MLQSPSGAFLGIPNIATGIIKNDDDVPIIQMKPPTITHPETNNGVTIFDFEVTRNTSGQGISLKKLE